MARYVLHGQISTRSGGGKTSVAAMAIVASPQRYPQGISNAEVMPYSAWHQPVRLGVNPGRGGYNGFGFLRTSVRSRPPGWVREAIPVTLPSFAKPDWTVNNAGCYLPFFFALRWLL